MCTAHAKYMCKTCFTMSSPKHREKLLMLFLCSALSLTIQNRWFYHSLYSLLTYVHFIHVVCSLCLSQSIFTCCFKGSVANNAQQILLHPLSFFFQQQKLINYEINWTQTCFIFLPLILPSISFSTCTFPTNSKGFFPSTQYVTYWVQITAH